MNLDYPRSFNQIATWAKQAKVSQSEGRARFAQYGILRAIADSKMLSSILVFKGGNALDFVWEPNRSTKDLDFSSSDPNLRGDQIKEFLGRSLDNTGRALGISFRVQRVDRQPPGEDKINVTYQVNVAYALQDDPKLQAKIAAGATCPQIVPLDISLNEPICADRGVAIDGHNELRVSTIGDIVAEKLRSLLQQPIRKRQRRQDVLDISVLLRTHQADLDPVQIADFLVRKAGARGVPVSRQAFHNPEVRERASIDYEELKATTRGLFIPFDEAYAAVLSFVDTLQLPE